MWESTIQVDRVFELRSRTLVYFGAGAIHKISDIADYLKKQEINRVLIVTDEIVYKITGAWEVIEPILKQKGISYEMYTGVVPNPTVDNIEAANELGKAHKSQAVIGIGGGSPIDVAKSVAVLLKNPEKTARELYELTFQPDQAVPIIAINTTHGTGTEVDRFAVASIPEKNYKPAIAYDCIYPLFSIDDPKLMLKLPPDQTRYVSVDAINHVTEAATSLVTSPYTLLTAQETVRLVAKYLPRALDNPEDLTARYYLLYASAIAGICFDNGLLHFTHALEHPLSGLKPDLAHGLGLSMLLPAVVKHIYSAVPEILASIFQPIVPGLKGAAAESEQCAGGVEKWLFSVGINSKLEDEGYKQQDIAELTKLAMTTPSLDTLLSVAPIEASEQTIRAIYEESLKKMF